MCAGLPVRRAALTARARAQLYEEICDAAQCTDTGCDGSDAPATVLLLPAAYSVINESSIPGLVDLLNIGELRGDNVGALTFGAEIPEYKNNGIKRRAFPTAPTWQARLNSTLATCVTCACSYSVSKSIAMLEQIVGLMILFLVI